MRHVSADVYVVRLGGPLGKVLVAGLSQELDFNVDHAGGLDLFLEEHLLDQLLLRLLGLFLWLVGVFLHRRLSRVV